MQIFSFFLKHSRHKIGGFLSQQSSGNNQTDGSDQLFGLFGHYRQFAWIVFGYFNIEHARIDLLCQHALVLGTETSRKSCRCQGW